MYACLEQEHFLLHLTSPLLVSNLVVKGIQGFMHSAGGMNIGEKDQPTG